jgi:adenylate cyclase
LISGGLGDLGVAGIWEGLCGRLVAGGVALRRGYLSAAALHPLQWASGLTWQDGRLVEAIDLPHGYDRETAWQTSPFRHMLQTRTLRLRRRLAGPGAAPEFPVLVEFRDAGLTDWLALLQRFG